MFAGPESDVIAVLPPDRAGDATVVFMRGESADRPYYVQFFFDGGDMAEGVLDDANRFVELSVLDHVFAFSDYSDTEVTVTHHSPDGSSESARTEIGSPSEVAARSSALIFAQSQSTDEEESWLDERLVEFTDSSNFHLTLNLIKTGGAAFKRIVDGVQMRAERSIESGKKIGKRLGNELTCLTETRRTCGEQAAEHAQQIARELDRVDPNRTTTAGFDVREDGITPKREEWEIAAQQATIPTDFTLTDVPCSESVFADMNPECPQYVPWSPTPTMDGGVPDRDGGAPTVDSGTPVEGDCTATSLGKLEHFYTCPTWSESYKLTTAGTLYVRLRSTTGELRDQMSMNFLEDGALYAYSVHNFDYDAQGGFVREESYSANSALSQSSYWLVTPAGNGAKMYVSVECSGGTAHRRAYTKAQAGDPPNDLYDVVDDNLEECSTVEKTIAFGQVLFPEAPMTVGFVQSTEVYKNYTAAQ